MKRALLDRLLSLRAEKRPAALVTETGSGRQALVAGERCDGDLALDDALRRAVRQAIDTDRSGPAPDRDDLFIHVFNPPLRMVVVGAVHIAQTLVPMARLAGYEVTLVDPRTAWASDARFPEITPVTQWPDEALTGFGLDRRCAVVTLTHDPKLDDPALAVALRSDAFYIGALGSRRTHGRRLERLKALGFTERDLDRIHGPVGLALGARSPPEVAVSILAQVTQVRHGAPPLTTVAAAE